MHYYEVAPNQIIRANNVYFTYASDTALTIGQLVIIEVGKKSLTGVILRATKKPAYETKAITSVIEEQPLPEPIVKLALWLSDYYATHLATVLQTILPRGLQKSRRERNIIPYEAMRDRTKIVFTSEQTTAITTVEQMTPGTALLHGVTGSGKTHVYIELTKRALSRGQSVILLVPEIALTSQLVDEFSHYFENTILTHSRQTEAERHTAWRRSLYSKTPQVVIGPRSALFLPLPHVGLIIIDEAHEPSLKQEQAPRYSALRAASILASYHNAKVVLGSATPAIADYYLAEKSKRPIITMATRARDDAVKPNVTLVDMTKRTNFKQHRFLSDKLLVQLSETFASGQQALVFHNRRGSAATTLCENCGWSAMCPRCFIPLTLHADKHHLRCHICGIIETVPTSCPECSAADIIHKGIGTKLIEAELRKLFPDKIIARFDGDTDTGETVEQRYQELYSGAIDLIVGTQVIAKGLDLPKLRSVGVVQADSGLSLPDYGASERTFQLLAQVIGRVGRSHHPTSVIVQSYQPTHPAVTDGLTQNYPHFYAATLRERNRAHFPPFTYLLKLTCIYKTEAAAIKNAQKLAKELRAKAIDGVQILGPTPAFYERQRDTYRWQLTLKSPKRAALVEIVSFLPPTHWQYELDPISLL
ncbi:MAG TPA: primosomal protein N' [Candidatus Saccharimonadales bacterium]|nr:primosomal protein N' [Candidatus Saccharimonadales bacterium]